MIESANQPMKDGCHRQIPLSELNLMEGIFAACTLHAA